MYICGYREGQKSQINWKFEDSKIIDSMMQFSDICILKKCAAYLIVKKVSPE